MKRGAVKWEGAMWLRRKYAGTEGNQDFTEFVSVFMVEVTEVFDYFERFTDDERPMYIGALPLTSPFTLKMAVAGMYTEIFPQLQHTTQLGF
jgi:hypothetical protein